MPCIRYNYIQWYLNTFGKMKKIKMRNICPCYTPHTPHKKYRAGWAWARD